MPLIFDAQYIQGKLKQGWTMNKFLEKYQTDEETLLSFVRAHDTNPVYAVFEREIKQNEKKAAKQKEKKEKASETPAQAVPAEEAASAPETAENVPEEPKAEPVTIKVIDPITQKINECERKLKELNDKKTQKTTLLKSHNRTISSAKDAIKLANADLKKLEKDYADAKKAFDKATTAYEKGKAAANSKIDSSNETIERNNKLVSEDQMSLNAIDAEIIICQNEVKALKRTVVTINEERFFFANKALDLPSSWEEIYKGLLTNPVAIHEELLNIQICSKLIAIDEELRESGEDYVFDFKLDKDGKVEALKTLFELVLEERKAK